LRDDIAIAAIVTRTAQDRYGTPCGKAANVFASAAPGALHQRVDIGAAVDQLLFGGAHLRHIEHLAERRVTISGHGRPSSLRESRPGAMGGTINGP
jgi:hypothetical protein